MEIGSQTAVSPPISIEVYNCFPQLTFASDLKIQVGSVTQIFNAIATNNNTLDCQDSTYAIKGLKNGIKFNNKTGKITV